MKNLITTIIQKSAYYDHSPIIFALKIRDITQSEGIKGLIRRIILWAKLIVSQPLRTSTWHKNFSSTSNTLNSNHCPTRPLTITVILPNYNHEKYLEERLLSIYNQTYPHIDVILLDDASTDKSREILLKFANRYPLITTCLFNKKNSGGVFHQWLKGFKAAKGDLIWIAESDDYCKTNFLETLVAEFKNPALRIAFCRSEFVDKTGMKTTLRTQQHLHNLGLKIWNKRFVAAAHSLTKYAWVEMNIIPNVSSCIFRHPQHHPLLDDDVWKSMRLCGDWIFYLAIARAGFVAYTPHTTNYYRQHSKNTSVLSQGEEIYYQEHHIVQEYLNYYYQLDYKDIARQTDRIYSEWCKYSGFKRQWEFEQIFESFNIKANQKDSLNIAIASFALVAGGGETFPLMLANLLHRRGHAVTVIDFNQLPAEEGIRKILLPEIPVISLKSITILQSIIDDFGIDIIHSHHGWVDMKIASLSRNRSSCKHVATMHGMYEMMEPKIFKSLENKLNKIDGFVYTAAKNIKPFTKEFQKCKHFERIDNAVIAAPYETIARQELGIGEDDFTLCLIARGRPDKGWQEAIEAVLLANINSARPIQLLLIGDGEEPRRLRPLYATEERIHFLGFQDQIRKFLSASDMGFIPTRFPGESFPLVLIDSIMCGKPVLASEIGEINSMLASDQGKAGITFALEEWEIPIRKLAELIIEIANNRELYQHLTKRAKKAARKFDPELMVTQYEEYYYKILRVT